MVLDRMSRRGEGRVRCLTLWNGEARRGRKGIATMLVLRRAVNRRLRGYGLRGSESDWRGRNGSPMLRAFRVVRSR